MHQKTTKMRYMIGNAFVFNTLNSNFLLSTTLRMHLLKMLLTFCHNKISKRHSNCS